MKLFIKYFQFESTNTFRAICYLNVQIVFQLILFIWRQLYTITVKCSYVSIFTLKNISNFCKLSKHEEMVKGQVTNYKMSHRDRKY